MPTVHERVVSDPAIMVGKPTIRGTRIPVEHILRQLGIGMSPEEVVDAYPSLTLEDVRAAQLFAADYLANEQVVFGEAEAV
jgi:uncharacterized protein (DUF433 family)